MKAEHLLEQTIATIKARRQAYGDADILFRDIAERWSITIGVTITPEQVILCMIQLKLGRLAHDPGHEDSIVDIAGYAACLTMFSFGMVEQKLSKNKSMVRLIIRMK